MTYPCCEHCPGKPDTGHPEPCRHPDCPGSSPLAAEPFAWYETPDDVEYPPLEGVFTPVFCTECPFGCPDPGNTPKCDDCLRYGPLDGIAPEGPGGPCGSRDPLAGISTHPQSPEDDADAAEAPTRDESPTPTESAAYEVVAVRVDALERVLRSERLLGKVQTTLERELDIDWTLASYAKRRRAAENILKLIRTEIHHA